MDPPPQDEIKFDAGVSPVLDAAPIPIPETSTPAVAQGLDPIPVVAAAVAAAVVPSLPLSPLDPPTPAAGAPGTPAPAPGPGLVAPAAASTAAADDKTSQTFFFKMFVGGLNWETNEDRLREYFGQFGEIADCIVMKDPHSGRSRGFGFVTFVESATCEKVLASGPHTLDGRAIDPKKAVPRQSMDRHGRGNAQNNKTRKIFVGGLPPEATEAALQEFFSQHGKVEDVVLMYDRETKRPRGFGFVTFDNEAIVEKLCEVHFHTLLDKTVEVKKAEPKPTMDSRRGGYRGGHYGHYGYGYGDHRGGYRGHGGYRGGYHHPHHPHPQQGYAYNGGGGGYGDYPGYGAAAYRQPQGYYQHHLAPAGGFAGGYGRNTDFGGGYGGDYSGSSSPRAPYGAEPYGGGREGYSAEYSANYGAYPRQGYQYGGGYQQQAEGYPPSTSYPAFSAAPVDHATGVEHVPAAQPAPPQQPQAPPQQQSPQLAPQLPFDAAGSAPSRHPLGLQQPYTEPY